MDKKYLKKIWALCLAIIMLIMQLAACSSEKSEGESTTAATGSSDRIGEFTTVDLNGEPVNQDVFKQAEITMINFWGTYCPPCIAEMPDLAGLESEYDGRMQLIGVVIDVDFTRSDSNEYKAALEILESSGAEFKNIAPAGDIISFMRSMQFVPTSIFVDSEGRVVGEPVVGAVLSEYKKVIDGYLAGSDQS